MKSRKLPQKKKSYHPKIEILVRKPKPFDLEKQGQYSDYWKQAAANAKELPSS